MSEIHKESGHFAWFTSRDLVDICDSLKGARFAGPQMIVTMVVAELEARHPEIGTTLDEMAGANSEVKFEAIRKSIPMDGCGCATTEPALNVKQEQP